MTENPFEDEVEAIGVVLRALAPLSGGARERVVRYVLNALDLSAAVDEVGHALANEHEYERELPEPGRVSHVNDIRTLREAKQPQTANEMAALVAYYVQELAPESERREWVNAADLEKYFKTAPYPLPSKISNTLGNAAGAGYFDVVGGGRYKLNPVGHNLVVHGLPAAEGARAPRKTTRKAAKKAPVKKAVAKKAPARKAPAKKAPAKKAPAKKSAS